MEWHCYLRNIEDLLAYGKTLYERRFGEHFAGLELQFGAKVEYHPITVKGKASLHQAGKALLSDVLHAGGSWKRDIVVAAAEGLEENHVPEVHVINAKEILAVTMETHSFSHAQVE